MSDTTIIILSVLAVIVILITMYFSYNNREISLRKEIDAQRGKIETVRDRMFQILREQANVSVEYRKSFEVIYPKIIEGRYRNGGELMKWINEANPNFDISLYQNLNNSIEVQRTAFTLEQNRMLDIINQRATLIESYPSRWFVREKSAIDYKPIVTSNTKEAMTTGIDDWSLTF